MTELATPPMVRLHADLRGAALIAAALLTVAGLTAVVVAAFAPSSGRAFLGFTFPGVRPQLGVMMAILGHNIRILAGLLAIAAVSWGARTLDGAPLPGRVAAGACDLVVVVGAAAQAVLVGAGVGAYGTRMVTGLLPHGPLELAAFSLALALYRAMRTEPIGIRRVVAVTAICIGALVVAAALETFVPG